MGLFGPDGLVPRQGVSSAAVTIVIFSFSTLFTCCNAVVSGQGQPDRHQSMTGLGQSVVIHHLLTCLPYPGPLREALCYELCKADNFNSSKELVNNSVDR